MLGYAKSTHSDVPIAVPWCVASVDDVVVSQRKCCGRNSGDTRGERTEREPPSDVEVF